MKNTVTKVLIVLIALMAFATGVQKIIPTEQMATQFTSLGFAVWFIRVLGLLWIAGAVGLFMRKLRPFALLGMWSILMGAIAVHVTAGDPLSKMLPAIILALDMSAVLYT